MAFRSPSGRPVEVCVFPGSLCLCDAVANCIGRTGDNECRELHGVHDGEWVAPRDILGESYFVVTEHDCREFLRSVENLWVMIAVPF
jgi:hypothetical protein